MEIQGGTCTRLTICLPERGTCATARQILALAIPTSDKNQDIPSTKRSNKTDASAQCRAKLSKNAVRADRNRGYPSPTSKRAEI